MHILKRSSFIVLPTLYIFYHHNKIKLQAKEPIKEEQFKIKDHLIKNDFKKSDLHLNSIGFREIEKLKEEAIRLAEVFRATTNAPGVVCGVSYRGKKLFSFGNGLADIETKSFCTEDSVMRIASNSKSVSMLLLGKLIEENRIDLDKPIYEYLDDKFPQKYFDNKKINITVRQLVSHLGGIRHYHKKGEDTNINSPEILLNKQFKNVYEALNIFKDDELINEPGTEFYYTTYGYTLIQAVIQSILDKESINNEDKSKNNNSKNKKSFELELLKLCKEIGMFSTYIDVNEQIIPNRSKYYEKDANDNYKLINVPQVNNSYKIAGGGLLSTVDDMLKFSNAILYSFKTSNGILKQDTMAILWEPNSKTNLNYFYNIPTKYAKGFRSSLDDDINKPKFKGLENELFNNIVYHTGSAKGCVSINLICPDEEIVLFIITNLNDCPGLGQSLTNFAYNVLKLVYKNRNELNLKYIFE